MKAVDEYFLMAMFMLLLNRVHVLAIFVRLKKGVKIKTSLSD